MTSYIARAFSHRRYILCRSCSAFVGSGGQNVRLSPSATDVYHQTLSYHPSTQERRYHISLSGYPDDNHSDPSRSNVLSDKEVTRMNLITRRLYRILLRSCSSKGVGTANNGNTIINGTHNSADSGDTINGTHKNIMLGNILNPIILLQPPLDPRKYGHADIVRARGGKTETETTSSTTTTEAMCKSDVRMAMEVLRFVHVSLGGDRDDDLVDYYLGSNEEMEETDDMHSALSVAAGRHSEGHYTNFIDEDEERGEGDTEKDAASSTTKDEENEEYGWNDDDDDEEYPQPDESVLVTSKDLQNAVRIAFRAPLVSASQSKHETQTTQTIISRRHRDAIDASALLSDQYNNWANKSSVFTDWEKGVRIVATAQCMHVSSTVVGGAEKKYRYAYRIRVENIWDLISSNNEQDGKDEQPTDRKTVQLLGRTWNISEVSPPSKSSLLTKLLEEGELKNANVDDSAEVNEGCKVVQKVYEPRTGAVGHWPVIHPGEVFQYMSGAELSSPKGAMEGCFHMAFVDEDTESAISGHPVEALLWKSNDERKFD
ncbi:predicted protein, partial [Thalassiosira pseudonana CCMP1335]